MAGDEILPQETEGKNLPTSSIDRNRSQDEAQEQEPAESMCWPCAILRAVIAFGSALIKWLGTRPRQRLIRRDIFYEAVREGDLNMVKWWLKRDKTQLSRRFTKFEENALQVAVVSGQEKIFSELMEEDDSNNILKKKNMYGETILTLAAAQGNIKIVKRLVRTCDELADIPNDNGDLPIIVAALFGNKEIVTFLFDVTNLEINSFNPSGRDVKEKDVVITNSTQSSVNDDEFKALKVSMTTQVYGHDERNYSFKLVNEDKDEAYKPAYQSEYHSFRLFKACISSQLYDLAYEVFKGSPTLYINEMVKENGKTIHPLARVFMKQTIGQRFLDWCFEFCESSLECLESCCGIDIDILLPQFKTTVESRLVNNFEKQVISRRLLRGICWEILKSENRYEIIQKVLSRPILIAVEQDNTSFIDTIREMHPDPSLPPPSWLLPKRAPNVGKLLPIFGFSSPQKVPSKAEGPSNPLPECKELVISWMMKEGGPQSTVAPAALFPNEAKPAGDAATSDVELRPGPEVLALSKDLFKIYISTLKNPEAGFLTTIRADRNGNTILHHAALLSLTKKLSRFPSPYLQMQSEIQWFKKVEKILPMYKGVENKDNLMPMDLFVQEHRKLKKAGGKWLKETASSCSIVAMLIITIMFSATFTVPGGYDNDTGIPINLGSKYFTIFIISDALSLFSSCTSAMLFLRIYTLDFKDEGFLMKLPLTLGFGIFTLFLSIVTMVIAFSAAFFLTLRETLESMTLPVFMLASIPVIVYSTSYLWIFIDVLYLTLYHLFNR